MQSQAGFAQAQVEPPSPVYAPQRRPADAQAQSVQNTTPSPAQSMGSPANTNVTELADYQKPTTRAPSHTPVENDAINDLRQELKSLRDVLEFQVSGLIQQEKQRSHPCKPT